ncbi:hypothetical protein [Xanthocytophaga agilis]|uniref:Uncharacterized protein n=1 Tax=Xanthocytophaga agilis TaxID=3048010 RepID=A0AAE3R4H5_9BACT|nr:hypothetical protein [Xanthocytophaga agilis]MDJ1503594.1 hypothetical protein [Xanthocytophaga agilis]
MQFQSPEYTRSRIEPFRTLELGEVSATCAQIIAEAESILVTASSVPIEKSSHYQKLLIIRQASSYQPLIISDIPNTCGHLSDWKNTLFEVLSLI